MGRRGKGEQKNIPILTCSLAIENTPRNGGLVTANGNSSTCAGQIHTQHTIVNFHFLNDITYRVAKKKVYAGYRHTTKPSIEVDKTKPSTEQFHPSIT